LNSCKGLITVGADIDWRLELLHVDFGGKLVKGSPTQDTIDYIAKRMTECPVSKNIYTVLDSKSIVTFDQG